MPSSPQNLHELLAGIELDEFFSKVWGKTPRVLPGAPGRLSGLCSTEVLPTLIARDAPRLTNVVAVRDGVPDESVWEELTTRLRRAEPIEPAALSALCGEATLIVNQVHHHHPPIADFARMVFSALGERVGVNAYLSPAGAGLGLGYHYDCWEVFVLQIEGDKRWQLYETPAPFPVERMELRQARVPTDEPALEVVLTPGDILYMPRGTWHRPQPTGSLSLHLTVGVHCKRPLDLTAWIEHVLRHEVELRRDLALSREGHAQEALQVAALQRAMGKVSELLAQPEAAHRFLRYCFEREMSAMWPSTTLRAADPLAAPESD